MLHIEELIPALTIGELFVAHCPAHGDYESRRLGESRASMCPQCFWAEREKLRQRDIQEIHAGVRADRLERLLRVANVPTRYATATLAEVEPQQKIAAWLSRVQRGSAGSLVLVGGVGTGKTHAAVATVKEACARGIFARYARTFDLAQKTRDAWDGETTEAKTRAWFMDPHVLVLDELGLGASSASDAERLHALIDGRYNEGKPTIYCSNLTPAKLAEHVGQRAASRMRDGAMVVDFGLEDRRTRKGGAE